MSAAGRARAFLRGVLWRWRAEREMHAEMAAHIEQTAERYRARGLSANDALHAARREFGNVADIQEQARDSRGARWIEQTISDVRHALRYFARTPLTTLTIVATLTLGVGVNTAAFALFEGVKHRPPPGVPANSDLVLIQGLQKYNGSRRESSSVTERQLSLRELVAYQTDSTFSAVAGWHRRNALLDLGDAEAGVGSVNVTYVTPNYFNTIGVALVAGAGFLNRTFVGADVSEMTTVVEHAFAVAEFGSPANALGRRLKVNDQLLTVVGVTPPKFRGIPARTGRPGIWVPLSAMRVTEPESQSFAANDSGYFSAAGRLRPDIDVATASARANAIGSRFTNVEATWEQFRNAGSRVVPARGFTDVLSPQAQAESRLASIAIAALDLVILLVCTTTVSSLLAGAAVARRHETVVRLALGATRARLVRQHLAESALLALTGGLCGLLIFATLCRLYATKVMEIDIDPSWSTALFTTAFAMVTAVLCGLSPALHATGPSLSNTLKAASNSVTARSRLQRTFVIVQIALAQPLLVCLTMFSVFIVHEYDRSRLQGVLEEQLIVARFDGGAARRLANERNSLDDLRLRIEALPEVVGVAFDGNTRRIADIGLPAENSNVAEIERTRDVQIETRMVSKNYFGILDIPLLAGTLQTFNVSTDGSTPVVVGTDFAQRVFGGGNPIGREFCLGICVAQSRRMRIIAVGDAKRLGASTNGHATSLLVFTPLNVAAFSSLLIRTRGPADARASAIRAAAKVAAPKLPLWSLETVAQTHRNQSLEMLQVSGATATGGLITLLLGCVGLYAVVSLAVGQRRREIGIRLALGADAANVVRMFFRDGLRLSAFGLAIGLPLSAALLRILATQVGFPPTNTVGITAGIAGLVVSVAALATWLPARRAAGVDPLDALKIQ